MGISTFWLVVLVLGIVFSTMNLFDELVNVYDKLNYLSLTEQYENAVSLKSKRLVKSKIVSGFSRVVIILTRFVFVLVFVPAYTYYGYKFLELHLFSTIVFFFSISSGLVYLVEVICASFFIYLKNSNDPRAETVGSKPLLPGLKIIFLYQLVSSLLTSTYLLTVLALVFFSL